MPGLTIGCHLSSVKGYLHMAKTAVSIGASTFQFFTRNPRGGKAKALDPEDIAAFHAYAEEQGMTVFLAHAPYTLNPAAADARVQEFARETFADDLARMEATPGQLYNFHPGSHVKQGVSVGIEKIAAVLNEVLRPEQTTTVLLETMAGKGTEVGRSFEELAAILDAVERRRGELAGRLGVCLDTCHVSDAGYDIAHDLDGVLAAFDRTVGLERLRAVHLNDSKNPCGARKDRHARIGEGYLGCPELGGSEEALAAIVRHPALRDLPFILETPNELVGYAREIALMRRLAGDA